MYLSSAFVEFLLKTFNNSASFFNLIVDVSETSGCTYVLAYFLIDQANLMSVIHDNNVFFNSKVSIVNFNSFNIFMNYLTQNYVRRLNPS